jgi:hypothetical protein
MATFVRREFGVLTSLLSLLVIAPAVAASTPATPAAASAHVWRVRALPQTPHSGEFTPYEPVSVSCPTPTWCMTVGSYGRVSSADVGVGSYAYSVVERHGRLVNKPIQAPSDLRADDQSLVSTLYSVSCLSPRFCLAVGIYNRRYPEQSAAPGDAASGLAERWNGRRWRSVPVRQATPHITGTRRDGFLFASVSCTSRRFCVAVGQHSAQNATGMLAMTYNGKRWHQDKLPKPINNLERIGRAVLDAVACPSVTRCLATGTSATGIPRVELRTRTGWHALAVPHRLQTAAGASLLSVSCAAADFCLIGEASDNTGRVALLGEFAGGRLHLVHVTAPKRTQSVELVQVFCFSRLRCTALGNREISHGDQDETVAVVEHLQDGRWSLASHKGLAAADIAELSCLGTTHCTAVGRDTDQGFFASET